MHVTRAGGAAARLLPRAGEEGPWPLRFRRARPGPLAGVRVLDLLDGLGELGTRYLADLGADVIRVEPPGGGRSRGLAPCADGVSLRYLTHNAGKRAVSADLASPAGAGQFLRLAGTADIVFEPGPAGWLAAAGHHAAAAARAVSRAGRGVGQRLRVDRAVPGLAGHRAGPAGHGRGAVPVGAAGPAAAAPARPARLGVGGPAGGLGRAGCVPAAAAHRVGRPRRRVGVRGDGADPGPRLRDRRQRHRRRVRGRRVARPAGRAAPVPDLPLRRRLGPHLRAVGPAVGGDVPLAGRARRAGRTRRWPRSAPASRPRRP